MYSVLFDNDGSITQLGPFATKIEADEAAKKAQVAGDFDITDTSAYLMTPDHRLIAYSMTDLGVCDDYLDEPWWCQNCGYRGVLDDFMSMEVNGLKRCPQCGNAEEVFPGNGPG